MRWRLFLVVVFLLLPRHLEAQEIDSQLGINGVREHLDLPYLAESSGRYTGNGGSRGDTEMTLDVYVPAGEGPFPVVMYVHGGSYTGGSKKLGGHNEKLARRLLEEGFAVASLNYILKEKGIFPQVFWDFSDAVRFLRVRSSDYNLDPARMGAWGISAGGWLASSATVGNGDLYYSDGSPITVTELKQQNWKAALKHPDEQGAWLRPMKSPQPTYADVHGGLSAIALDFDHDLETLQPYNPLFQKWVGVGYTPKWWDDVVANGAEANVELIRMPSERHRGKNLHIPPFWPKNEREADRAVAIDIDGSQKYLGDVIIEFFKRRLVKECRLPAPEIYPIPRVFQRQVEVSLVAPPGATLYYTTDGSEPKPDGSSKTSKYENPFTINSDTVVKSLAVRNGFANSGVNVAHFVTGPALPKITWPEELPAGKTGERFEIKFQSDIDNPKWLLQGDLVPHVPWRAQTVLFPNNMSLDAETGQWSGTPFKPGKFWVQVWVNNGPGTPSGYRDFIWEVTGEEKPGEAWSEEATDRDTNIELVRLKQKGSGKAWHSPAISLLVDLMRRRGVKHLLVGEGKEIDLTLIVDQRDSDLAKDIIDHVIESFKLENENTHWLGQ